MTTSDCSICDRIDRYRAGTNPYVIEEFRHGLWVVGDHQFFPGYTMLLLKDHVRELVEMDPQSSAGFFEELLIATGSVMRVFAPWKMNYSCYGNLDPHLHWHLIPRHADEEERTRPPWHFSERFGERAIGPEEAAEIAARLRKGLAG